MERFSNIELLNFGNEMFYSKFDWLLKYNFVLTILKLKGDTFPK